MSCTRFQFADELVLAVLADPKVAWLTHHRIPVAGMSVEEMAASCTEAYRESCSLLAFPRSARAGTSG